MATIIAILIAVYLRLHPFLHEMNATILGIFIIAVALPFLFVYPLGSMWSWLPLQKTEQNMTPRIIELFAKDGHISLAGLWMTAFSLISFAIALDILYTHAFDPSWLFAAWIILLGISIDAMRHFIRRITAYLNPFAVIPMFSKKAKESIRNDKEIELCHWIDALSEIAIKGIHRNSTSIGNLALNEERDIAQLFFEAAKNLSHHEEDPESKTLGKTDKATYTSFYLYQRLDMIYEKALNNKLEVTCSQIITIFGKIALDAAKYDVSMASVPLRFLGKCAVKAQEAGLEESAITASCVLSAVAKAILTDIDVTYYEIKDPFLSIINSLETLAKGAFRRNKDVSIAVLIQPFKELRALFENEKMQKHQDTKVIVQNIDRVVGEFEAVQMVMKTMPPISDIAQQASNEK